MRTAQSVASAHPAISRVAWPGLAAAPANTCSAGGTLPEQPGSPCSLPSLRSVRSGQVPSCQAPEPALPRPHSPEVHEAQAVLLVRPEEEQDLLVCKSPKGPFRKRKPAPLLPAGLSARTSHPATAPGPHTLSGHTARSSHFLVTLPGLHTLSGHTTWS